MPQRKTTPLFCNCCKQTLDRGEFPNRGGGAQGHTRVCKPCWDHEHRVPDNKECLRCGKDKEKGAFRRSHRSVDGLMAHCIVCERIKRLGRVPSVKGLKESNERTGLQNAEGDLKDRFKNQDAYTAYMRGVYEGWQRGVRSARYWGEDTGNLAQTATRDTVEVLLKEGSIDKGQALAIRNKLALILSQYLAEERNLKETLPDEGSFAALVGAS